MVAAGLTVLDPFKATLPILWSIKTEVALAVAQVRVEDWPGMIEAGSAAKVTIGFAALTFILTLAVARHFLFLTVMVYVVVLVGVTAIEPLIGTVPMPLLMEAEVAPVEVQVRVEEPPVAMVVGAADILTVGRAAHAAKAKLPYTIAPIIIPHLFLAIRILPYRESSWKSGLVWKNRLRFNGRKKFDALAPPRARMAITSLPNNANFSPFPSNTKLDSKKWRCSCQGGVMEKIFELAV